MPAAPQGKDQTMDKTSLWDGLNIQKEELFVNRKILC